MAFIEVEKDGYINSKYVAGMLMENGILTLRFTDGSFHEVEGEDIEKIHKTILEQEGHIRLNQMEEPDA